MATKRCIDNPNWDPIRKHYFWWTPTIERALCALPLPALSGPTISMFSDYGGEHKGSMYDVISVLCADLRSSLTWEMGRRSLRTQGLPDGRRLSFKALNDRHRRRALVPFLRFADQIDGLCITVAIRKTLRGVFVDDASLAETIGHLGLKCPWGSGRLEKAMHVCHLIAFLTGGLVKVGQNMYWISDEDAMFANPRRTEDLRLVVQGFTKLYAPGPLGELGIGTTGLDEDDRHLEDLVAIPDLAAGVVCEAVNTVADAAGGRIPMGVGVETGAFSAKSEVLRQWLWSYEGRLAKAVIVFDHAPGDVMAVFQFAVSDG